MWPDSASASQVVLDPQVPRVGAALEPASIADVASLAMRSTLGRLRQVPPPCWRQKRRVRPPTPPTMRLRLDGLLQGRGVHSIQRRTAPALIWRNVHRLKRP